MRAWAVSTIAAAAARKQKVRSPHHHLAADATAFFSSTSTQSRSIALPIDGLPFGEDRESSSEASTTTLPRHVPRGKSSSQKPSRALPRSTEQPRETARHFLRSTVQSKRRKSGMNPQSAFASADQGLANSSDRRGSLTQDSTRSTHKRFDRDRQRVTDGGTSDLPLRRQNRFAGQGYQRPYDQPSTSSEGLSQHIRWVDDSIGTYNPSHSDRSVRAPFFEPSYWSPAEQRRNEYPTYGQSASPSQSQPTQGFVDWSQQVSGMASDYHREGNPAWTQGAQSPSARIDELVMGTSHTTRDQNQDETAQGHAYQAAQSRGSSPRRSSDTSAEDTLRAGPRATYLELARQTPSTFPFSPNGPPPPLPLLVLDLNGTLVFRLSRQQGNTNPVRRPYLSSFLAYCQGVKDPSFDGSGGSGELGAVSSLPKSGTPTVSDDEAFFVRQSAWARRGISVSDPTAIARKTQGIPHPHGAHFWFSASEDAPKGQAQAPEVSDEARWKLFVWSSAQPQNVNTMVQAAFHPCQAAQLARCWARDTLVTSAMYDRKAPSTKDLEIIWNSLNSALDPKEALRASVGEKRVLANYRVAQDAARPDKGTEDEGKGEDRSPRRAGRASRWDQQPASASVAANRLADVFVHLSTESTPGVWSEGRGYGPHNTLLLDDSTSKARLQPYNHLLVPEFDRARAQTVPAARRADQYTRMMNQNDLSQPMSDSLNLSTPPPSSPTTEQLLASIPSNIDTILLQTVGVLEHARWQRNVAAWIYHGGLGSFAGMTQPGSTSLSPSADGTTSQTQSQPRSRSRSRTRSRSTSPTTDSTSPSTATKKAAEEGDHQDGPRLSALRGERTEAFWQVEGQRALSRLGIPLLL